MRKPIKYLLIILFTAISSLSYAQGPYNADIVVTKTTDEDPFMTQDVVDGIDIDPVHIALVEGTLQWAIRKANKDVGADHIVFQIPNSGTHIINIQFELPFISDILFIDGTSQTGYLKDFPNVIIDGGNNITVGTCFRTGGVSESTVKGLYIRNFWNQGFWIYSNIKIIDNVINQIGLTNSVNAGNGIRYFGDNNIIQGNALGTDFQLSDNLGISSTGILCWGGAQNSKIGGVNFGEGNIITNCQFLGINVQDNGTDFNIISRNIIYNNANKAINILFGNQNKPKPIISSISPTGNVVGTAQAGDLVEIFGSTGNQNANEYLTTVTADASGNWSASLGVLPWSYITATATDFIGKNAPELENTSELSIAHSYPVITCPTTVDFTYTGTCVNQSTDFTVNTTDDLSGSTLTWDFGDGTTETGIGGIGMPIMNPSHTFADYCKYDVKLTITGPTGCETIVITKRGVGNLKLIGFKINPFIANACVNTSISFEAAILGMTIEPGCSPGYSQAASFAWNFGDNSQIVVHSPTNTFADHSYVNPGTYTLELVITYENGCIKTVTKEVVICTCSSNTSVDFTFAGGTCINEPAVFTVNTTDDLSSSTLTWDFGDGVTETGTGGMGMAIMNPSHTYASNGTKTITLTITGTTGCTPLVISHTLTIDVLQSCTVLSTISGCINTLTSFEVSCTSQIHGPPQVAPSSFAFDFGDGETSIDDNSHTYTTPGEYPVTVIITYTNGCTTTLTTTAIIGCCNNVDFTISGGCLNDETTFTLSDLTIDPSIVTWDFGDGNIATNILNPTHTYTTPDNYEVQVTINYLAPCASILVTKPLDIVDVLIVNKGDGPFCIGESLVLIANQVPHDSPVTHTNVSVVSYSWDLGGITFDTEIVEYTFSTAGTYTITLTVVLSNGCTITDEMEVVINGICDPCEHCIGSFAPLKGKKYVLSAWVKENTPSQVKTYVGPEIILNFTSTSTTIGPFKAKGQIIDGWQRMEEEFIIPLSATDIVVKLNNSAANEVYFDDIRIHPFDANMKSFVYDPITLKLVAELDGNNYATFYEYDEEGKLIRVKKETERGIKTIQESREHTVK